MIDLLLPKHPVPAGEALLSPSDYAEQFTTVTRCDQDEYPANNAYAA